MFNRYDDLKAKQKKLKNKIYKRTVKDNFKIEKLKARIDKVKYGKNLYCNKINNQLKDVDSLIENETNRIFIDYKEQK